MREIRPYGSARGVRRKPYPYRDAPPSAAPAARFLGMLDWHGSPVMQSSFGTRQNGKVRQPLPDEIAHGPVKLK